MERIASVRRPCRGKNAFAALRYPLGGLSPSSPPSAPWRPSPDGQSGHYVEMSSPVLDLALCVLALQALLYAEGTLLAVADGGSEPAVAPPARYPTADLHQHGTSVVEVTPPQAPVPINGIAEWTLTFESLSETALGDGVLRGKSLWEALNITLDLVPPAGAAPYNATHRGFLYAGGGSVWKVRAALRAEGSHSYTLRASWTGNSSLLHTSQGVASCSSAAPLQNYSAGSRGFLRPRFNDPPYRTAYEDGKLFTGLGLGDCLNDGLTFLTYNETDGGQYTRSLEDYTRDYGNAGFNIFRWSNGNCAWRIEESFDGNPGRPNGNVYNETLVLQLDRLYDTFRAHGWSINTTRFCFANGTGAIQGAQVRGRILRYGLLRQGCQCGRCRLRRTSASRSFQKWVTGIQSIILHSVRQSNDIWSLW